MSTTTTITAIPAGRDRNGTPHTRPQTYRVDSRREQWGEGRTRIFQIDPVSARHGLRAFAPVVVLTDSIVEA